MGAKEMVQCGEIITWSVHDYVSRQALVDALKAHGISVPVKRTDKKTYLKRALQECVAGDVLREIGEDEHQCAYAIVEEDTDVVTASWTGMLKEAVILDKQTGDIKLRNYGERSLLLKSILSAVSRNEGGLISQEVGRVFRCVIEKHSDCISLRGIGGVYFIPDKDTPVLDKLHAVISEIQSRPGTIRLRRFAVAATDGSEESLRDVVEYMINGVASRLRADADALVHDDGTTPKAFVNRINELAKASKTLCAYEALLNKSLTDVQTHVEATRKVLNSRLKQCVRQRKIRRLKKRMKVS